MQLWTIAFVAALPAGLAAAVLRARYSGRPAPTPAEAVGLLVAADMVAGWALLAGPERALLQSCLFGWLLLALAAVDLETRRLPDPLNLVLVASGLLVTWLSQPEALGEHALAAALAWGLFYGIGELYYRLRGREGLGLGDAKLLAGIGAWTGLVDLPGVVFYGALAAILAVLGSSVILRRPLAEGAEIPFGPYLALAAWVSWLHGPFLLDL